MDELSVFDRSLTDVEVKSLFNLPTGVRELHAGSGSGGRKK
jgi:hypothetical protein